MTPEISITLSGGYYLHSYKRLLRDLEPALMLDVPSVLNVDMTKLTFMGPAALATTTATLMKARDAGLIAGGAIAHPQAKGIYRYLHRMDFFRVLFHEPDFPDPSTRHGPDGLLECQHFKEDKDLRGVAAAILAAIEQKRDIDAMARYALDTCLSEVVENVLFHAYTEHGGVAAVQAFKKELEIAIVDLGEGIAASLARNPTYAELARRDDITAIRTAMTPNVTSTPHRNKGWGLAFTELLLALNGGKLFVRSGQGLVIRGPKNTDKLDDVTLPGTLVAMRIRLDQPLDYSKAWESLGKAVDSLSKDADHDRDSGGAREAR